MLSRSASGVPRFVYRRCRDISGGCAARFVAKRQSNFVEIETESVEMRSDCMAQAVGCGMPEFEAVDQPDHGFGQ